MTLEVPNLQSSADRATSQKRMIAMAHNPYSVGAELNTSATDLQGPTLAVSVRTMQLIAVGLMTAKFPTRDKVSFWIEDKLRELQLRYHS